jgi:hypothetical protein
MINDPIEILKLRGFIKIYTQKGCVGIGSENGPFKTGMSKL